MWMKPAEQEDEEDEFAALVAQLADEPLPNKEAAPEMRSADLATPMEPEPSMMRDGVDRSMGRPLPSREEALSDGQRVLPNVGSLEELTRRARSAPADRSEFYRESDAPVRDPFGLTSEEDLGGLAAYVAEQQKPRGDNPYDLPTASGDPRFADARQLPGASPAPRPELPEQRPAFVPDTPGPSPMWEKYSRQGAHMGSGGGGGLSALASRGSYGGGMGGPPMAQDNSLLYGLAALADFGMNKGRNTGALLGAMGQDVDYENYNRQMAHQKAMADLAATNRRGTYGARGMDPLTYELRKQALDLQRERLGLGFQKEGRMGAESAQRYGIDEAELDRRFLIANGVDPNLVAGMNRDQIKQQRSILTEMMKQSPEMVAGAANRAGAISREQALQTMQPKIATAKGISDVTQANKLELVREGAQLRNQAEAQSPQFQAQQQERYRTAADQYAKETDRYRGVAQQVQRARAITDKYKGKNLPGLGMLEGRLMPDEYYAMRGENDALEIRNAQRLMNDLVLRAQTGAAAPLTEQQQVQVMTGSKPGATEAEFLMGLQAMNDYSVGQLRAFSAGKEEPAREVLRLQGIEGMVFPPPEPGLQQTISTPRPAPRKPARSSAPKAKAQPAAGSGRVITADELEADDEWEDM